jgi:DNA-binding NtrC family response regulator
MTSRYHILIVDDETLVVEILLASLEEKYRVISANNVGEAHAFLTTTHVDLALVDGILSDGRGSDVAAFATTLGVPVVVMSGYPPEMIEVEQSDCPHLLKPFKVDTLLSTVEEILESNPE